MKYLTSHELPRCTFLNSVVNKLSHIDKRNITAVPHKLRMYHLHQKAKAAVSAITPRGVLYLTTFL